jgi:hypothetical protein
MMRNKKDEQWERLVGVFIGALTERAHRSTER